MAEDLQRLFVGVRDFGWDPKKRESILRDREIDFDDAREVFNDYSFIRRSDRHGEIRYQVFGYVKGREIAVVCTLRAERRKYYDRLSRRTKPGQN